MVQGRKGAGDGQVSDHAHGRRHHDRDHELDAGRLRQVQVRRHQQSRLGHDGMRSNMRRYLETERRSWTCNSEAEVNVYSRVQHERRAEEHVGPDFVLGWVINLMTRPDDMRLSISTGWERWMSPLGRPLWSDRKKAPKGIFNPEAVPCTQMTTLYVRPWHVHLTFFRRSQISQSNCQWDEIVTSPSRIETFPAKSQNSNIRKKPSYVSQDSAKSRSK